MAATPRAGTKPGERTRSPGTRRAIKLYLGTDFIAEIDSRRGLENRSSYVERMVRDIWAVRSFDRPPPTSRDRDNREFFGV